MEIDRKVSWLDVSTVDISTMHEYMVLASFSRTQILTPSHLQYGIQAQNRSLIYVANSVIVLLI